MIFQRYDTLSRDENVPELRAYLWTSFWDVNEGTLTAECLWSLHHFVANRNRETDIATRCGSVDAGAKGTLIDLS